MPFFLQDLLEFSYLQRSVIAILLACVACGIVGGYVVAQRQSYMIGAVSHSLLGGVGLARFLQVTQNMLWFTPLLGAIGAAIAAAALITALSGKGKSREDAVLSAVWSLGVALGVSCIAATPGYTEDLNSYLFGSILLVSTEDIIIMAVLDAAIVALAYLFHNRFLAYCFHAETLELRGLSPTVTALLLNLITALTVVLLAQVVGIILVLVLLVLPAAIASLFARRLSAIMMLAGLACLIFSLLGIIISYQFDWPTGATTVEITVIAFLLANLIASCTRHKRQSAKK